MANRAKYDNPDTKSTKGVWYDHCDPGKNPYESRYGASWRDHLPAKFATTSIKVLIDHVIEEGNRLFADTVFAKSWFIYHDALPQWWEKEAQDYLRERGFEERQWRARGDTNENVAGHYVNKLMGDSPELMPLDSSLFSDLIEKVAWLVMATTSLPEGRRYSMGTPDEAWKTMVDAWEEVPEARILRDIDRFEEALDAIILAEGAYVPDKDLRNGHRKVMQRLVRGGAGQGDGGRAATKRLEEGMRETMASWKGLTTKCAIPTKLNFT